MTLLGAHALEGMNVRIDPVRKELVPAGPVIAAAAQARRYDKAPAFAEAFRVGTAGFELNSVRAGPLVYRHLGAPQDRIGTYWLQWTGKHYGKQVQ